MSSASPFRLEPLKHANPATYKAAFFDIDGTLVNRHHVVSRATAQALAALKAAGMRLCLATGRPHFACEDLIATLGIDGPCLSYSGGLIVDLSAGKALLAEPLSPVHAAVLLAAASDRGVYYEAYTKDSYLIAEPHPFADVHATYLGRKPVIAPGGARELAELAEREPLLKIGSICRADSGEVAIWQELVAELPGVVLATAMGAAHPELMFVSVTSAAAERGRGFAVMTEHLGITAAEVIAFGDGMSDLAFIKLAGLGVAMANGAEELRRAADAVTLSVDDDGVAEAVRLLLETERS